MSIFTHVMIGTNDIGKSRDFYDSVLGALGLKRLMEIEENATAWGADSPQFFVGKPRDGNKATPGNGHTIGLIARDRTSVRGFHENALAKGGLCAGPPGPREWAPSAYAAYIRDPDGNKLCAFTMSPE